MKGQGVCFKQRPQYALRSGHVAEEWEVRENNRVFQQPKGGDKLKRRGPKIMTWRALSYVKECRFYPN